MATKGLMIYSLSSRIAFNIGIVALFGVTPAFAISTSTVKFTLPQQPAQQLATEFPKAACESAKELASFRKCRVELDIFLRTALEPYNEDIQAYREKLIDLSKMVESARRRGELTQSAYEETNAQLAKGLDETSKNGYHINQEYIQAAENHLQKQK